jgi:predicted permease
MRKLVNWLRRAQLESGLDRELQYHLDRRIAELEASGLSPAEASRKANLELGGVAQIREEVQDVWLTRWMRDFVYDLRFSLRSFRRTPAFTITAVLSLMLGIAATTAIYSLVDQVLLHALPVRQPDRLALIDWHGDSASTNAFGSWNLMSYPICRDLDEQKQFFDGVFCRALTTVDLSTGGENRPARAEIVSGNYFSILGVGPALGQVIATDDDRRPGSNPAAVISYDFWKMQLGGARDVIGREVLVNRHPLKIIGVAARTFNGIDIGDVPSLWIPTSMSGAAIPGFNDLLNPRVRWMQVLGRLKEGVTLHTAQVGLQPWFQAMLREDMRRPGFPVITTERRRAYLNSSLALTPAPEGHSGLRRQMSEPLWVLFAGTAVLLGLACLNVSGLFLARGSARDREISTRLALGASRGRLARQLLADSLLIALVGGALGIAAAPIAIQVLIALLPTRDSALTALHSGIDSRLLLFAFLASLVAGAFSGLAPAWQSRRYSFVSSLRERGGTGFAGVRLRKIIVTAQIALTLILVVGAGLFVRTLDALLTKGPGFATSSLVSFSVDSRLSGYSQSEGGRVIHRLDDAIRHAPITQQSAIARYAFLTGGSWNNPMTIVTDKRFSTEDHDINLNAVTPGFFQTMGIRILAGRNFNEHDVDPAAKPTWQPVIVNEAFVTRYLAGRNPVGVRLGTGTGPDVKANSEIVGVVSNFAYRNVREDSEQAYFPFQNDGAGTFYVRVHGKAEASFQSLRAIVRSVAPGLAVTDLRTLEEQVDRSLNTQRTLATLSSTFGIIALLLSLVGLYGVMSFVVSKRTREIGIRLALGATRASAIWLVFRDALAMIVLGIVIGLPVVFALGRLVESQLYNVKPTDPVAIGAAILSLGVAAIAAALIPARRASGVNPTDALRAE